METKLSGHGKSITELVRACGPVSFMDISAILKNSMLPIAVLEALVNAQETGYITLQDGRYFANCPEKLWCVSICIKVKAATETEAVDKVLKEYAPLFAD